MLALLHAWVLFPVALGLVGYGLGLLAQEASGRRIAGVLLVPTGLAATIVIASILTSWSASAPAATPVVAVLALAGLTLGLVRHGLPRPDWWALAAALGALLVYGAPVLASGEATFNGYVTLDDTATWLAITDQLMSHGRALASLPSSTYSLVLGQYIGTGYPIGAFVTLGVGHALVDIDAAWVFQPYESLCAAMVALGGYALLTPIVASRALRALSALVAACAALLYGYAMWGGIKELTLAYLLVLFVALGMEMLPKREGRPQEAIPVALAAGALVDVIGPGGAVWVVPLMGLISLLWLWRARITHTLRAAWIRIGALAGLTLIFMLPTFLIFGDVLSAESAFTGSQPNRETELGSLFRPLSVFQLGGIWPVHDFRIRPDTTATAILLTIGGLAAIGALIYSYKHRRAGVALYVGLAVFGVAAGYLYGTNPWINAKNLALSSPAIPLAAMTGAALLFYRSRIAGALVLAIIAGGVIWSNALAYHDVTLAPRARLAELEHIGTLVKGKGPTFINEYEKYAEQHFLREGRTIQMSKKGIQIGNLEVGDLDDFALARVEFYRSIVTPRSPVESRPPSIYDLVWQGRYYDLWQRPTTPQTEILEHVPLGEPVATPPCPQIQSLAGRALSENARLVAYQRPAPIVVPAVRLVYPVNWTETSTHALTPTSPGRAVASIAVAIGQRYEVWLDGSFQRGFEVSGEGDHLGGVEDELSVTGGYIHVADVFLAPGRNTLVLTYPHANLSPGSGNDEMTTLSAIALEPRSPPRELIEVAPRKASQLCGRPLNWIELVRARP